MSIDFNQERAYSMRFSGHFRKLAERFAAIALRIPTSEMALYSPLTPFVMNIISEQLEREALEIMSLLKKQTEVNRSLNGEELSLKINKSLSVKIEGNDVDRYEYHSARLQREIDKIVVSKFETPQRYLANLLHTLILRSLYAKPEIKEFGLPHPCQDLILSLVFNGAGKYARSTYKDLGKEGSIPLSINCGKLHYSYDTREDQLLCHIEGLEPYPQTKRRVEKALAELKMIKE